MLFAPARRGARLHAVGLARQLRLVGVDAEAVPCAHKMQRHLVHR